MTRVNRATSTGFADRSPAPQLAIAVRCAVGFGPTELAAFDDALHAMNIANFNLILLSSVIPAGAIVTVEPGAEQARPAGAWGDRLYVVMAEKRSSTAGERVAAGVGWVQDPDTGKGLFVEHEGRSAAAVDQDIQSSLNAMLERRTESFDPIRHQIISEVTPPGAAACALVVATFESQPWAGRSRVGGLLN